MLENAGVTLLVASIIFFVYYRRIRRSFGRQKISRPRLGFRVAVLSLFAAVLLLSPLTSSLPAIGGITLGCLLATFGLRLTTFEYVEGAHHYTPSSYIGIVVVALLLGRLVARGFRIGGAMSAPALAEASRISFDAIPLFQGSLTRGLLFVLIAYYVTYYFGLLLRSRP